MALDKLKEKALHALFRLRKHTNILSKLPPLLVHKIFDTMISPILHLTAKSGVYTKNLISSLGTVRRLKKLIYSSANVIYKVDVRNKASNMACRAELGRFPLIIAINQKIINYFLHLHNKGNDSIVKQIFLMSADLRFSGKSSFYSSVMRMSEYYNLPDFDPNVLIK